MEVKRIKLLLFNIFVAANIQRSLQCPSENEDEKALYKSGETLHEAQPISLSTIKQKLKDSGVFDWHDPSLNEREKKELSKLFEAVEIMIMSRARQPANVQNMFSSLRIVERAVKKQLKEGQISDSLSAKFNWDKLTIRHKRVPSKAYHKNAKTNMRDFKLSP